MALSWTFAMTYELSITVDGTGIGGMHPDTRASFVLAQGIYIPLALITVAVVWRWQMGFRDLFFFAFGFSLNEALIFRPVLLMVLMSPAMPLAPVYAGYYAMVYACFIALPFLIVAPASIHGAKLRPPPGAFRLILLGAVLGFAANVFWGLVYGPWAGAGFPPLGVE